MGRLQTVSEWSLFAGFVIFLLIVAAGVLSLWWIASMADLPLAIRLLAGAAALAASLLSVGIGLSYFDEVVA